MTIKRLSLALTTDLVVAFPLYNQLIAYFFFFHQKNWFFPTLGFARLWNESHWTAKRIACFSSVWRSSAVVWLHVTEFSHFFNTINYYPNRILFFFFNTIAIQTNRILSFFQRTDCLHRSASTALRSMCSLALPSGALSVDHRVSEARGRSRRAGNERRAVVWHFGQLAVARLVGVTCSISKNAIKMQFYSLQPNPIHYTYQQLQLCWLPLVFDRFVRCNCRGNRGSTPPAATSQTRRRWGCPCARRRPPMRWWCAAIRSRSACAWCWPRRPATPSVTVGKKKTGADNSNGGK